MKKITLGKALGTIAVLCLLWVSIMLTIGFCEHYESDEQLADIYSSECRSFISDEKYSIRNMTTGKTTIDGIDWLFAAVHIQIRWLFIPKTSNVDISTVIRERM